tara:strand:- start:1410 stop:2966 length:1557 start_codon:yes stop_codon:yes gene_type:complete
MTEQSINHSANNHQANNNPLNKLKSAWGNRGEMGDKNLSVVQRQFLPLALEVQETPPSPAGRWLAWSLMALFTIGILWACFGKVDIVVVAPGRIIPSGHVKIIQPLETGIVKQIHVRDGDKVEAGQPLISLDPTNANADNLRVKQQIGDLSLQLNWRQALESWLASDRTVETPIAGLPSTKLPSTKLPIVSPAEASIEAFTGTTVSHSINASEYASQSKQQRKLLKAQQLYRQQRDEISARLQSFEKERDAATAEQNTARAELERTEQSLPILSERVGAYKYLYDKQYGAKVQYLQILQQQVEMEKSIPVLKSRQRQLQETVASYDAKIDTLLLEQRKNNLLELERLTNDIASLQQDAIKANQRQKQQILTAPVNGTVQQLAIHTVGGVVTPAQELMKVVPEQAIVEVEALIQNKDIGFIHEGQIAEVKVDTFNFTKYGIIDAEVTSISQDAIADENLGWVFQMRVKLSKDQIDVEDKSVRLSPGMSVTAEIKTGKRRLIEFFLSPLLRYKQESVRER